MDRVAIGSLKPRAISGNRPCSINTPALKGAKKNPTFRGWIPPSGARGYPCVAQHHPHGFLSTSTAKTGFKAISSEHHRNMSTMFPVRICTLGLSAQPAENLSSRTTIHSSLPFCPRPSSVRTLLLHAIGTRTRCTTDVCRNGLESCPFWPTGLKIFIHCLFFWNARERLLVLQGPEKVEVCNFAQALL